MDSERHSRAFISKAIAIPSAGAVSAAAAFTLSNYDPHHTATNSNRPPSCTSIPELCNKIAIFCNAVDSKLPLWARNPDATTYALSWNVFAFTALFLYHEYQADKAQNLILVSAALLGAVKSLLAWVLGGKNVLVLLTGDISCFVVAGLAISIAVHRILELIRPREQAEHRQEKSGGIAQCERPQEGEKKGSLMVEEC